jgi:mannose-6-phosphate isomerase-like protein (cupin superfamily)
MDDAAEDNDVQHVYDFAKLDRLAEGSTSLAVAVASSAAPVLTGRSMVCTLVRQPAGDAVSAHGRSSERFDYILRGTLVCDVEGERVTAAKGAIVHTPAGVTHNIHPGNNQDVLFYEVADTRANTGSAPEQVGCKRYVYDMRDIDDSSRALASAEVTRDAALRLPPGITGKLLTGERLHVGVLRLEPGRKISNYRKDNEQLVFAAEGDLEVLFDEDSLDVPQYCVLHLPPGTHHEIVAPHGAVIVIAQDKGEAE